MAKDQEKAREISPDRLYIEKSKECVRLRRGLEMIRALLPNPITGGSKVDAQRLKDTLDKVQEMVRPDLTDETSFFAGVNR